MQRALLSFFLALACAGIASANPVITEFMASNHNSIADEDGDHSDWVEIYNPDSTDADMTNWSMTDDATKLRKWIFPAVTIPAKSYIIVWASSKNRRTPGLPLHTNFSLSVDGEYLGLVKPDGVTKTTEFAPTFPAQVTDVSYGVSGTVGASTLAAPGSAVKVLIPTSASLGATWQGRTFDDSAWLAGTTAVGFFNYNGTSSPDLSAQLGLDVKTQMGGNGKSAYLRIPFNVVDPAKVQSLKLQVSYDDGFAAYINGTAAASANAPSPLAYNSQASTTHTPGAYTIYDVTSLIPQLVAGTNILSFQGLNATNSSDFFIQTELDAQVDTGQSVTGYFTTATPGAANGGPDTIRLPQTVAFSQGSGPFTTSFQVTLSGAATGQQIRYILADPTTGTGAAVAAPTGSSLLYTGPITISSSKLIRAAVFNPNNNQLGNPTTAQYLQLETSATLNTSTFTSNLPLMVIDDHGKGSPVDSSTGTFTNAMLYIFDRGTDGTSLLSAKPTLATRAGFHIRGRTSSTFPKKGFGIQLWDEFNTKSAQSLLGLTSDSKWDLSNPWKYDDVFFHNAFIYEVSRRIGRWASRTRMVELYLSTNGATSGQSKLDYTDYNGVYELVEKLESGSNRLDITTMDSGDISGDALTGGYIYKMDDLDTGEEGWTTTKGYKPVLVEPDADTSQPEQLAYIQNYLQTFETTVFNERTANFSTRNYRKYIDVPSWIDHSLLEALAYNVDGFHLSAYFNKDRNSKIHAGPIWDFDRALNSDDGRDANPRSWSSLDMAYAWWGQLLRDPDYVQAWVDRWYELRRGVFSDANLNTLVDQFGNEVGSAAGARDAARWPGTDGDTPESGSYLGEVAALKTWLTSTDTANLGRTNWIDTQFPGPPTTATDSAANVTPGTTVTLSGVGTILYTLDNTDPRAAGGGTVSPAAATYGTPITINKTTVLTARRTGTFTPHPSATSIGWSAPLQRVYLVNETFAAAGDIVISEIHYDPADPTDAEKAAVLEVAATHFEFIELKNVSNRTVNTFEMQFADTIPVKGIKFSPLSLAPGQVALVVKNKEAFLARYGSTYSARIVGEWTDGSLDNGGERIQLLARDGSVIQDFTYPDLSKNGLSLNRVDAANWKIDVPSPGTDGPTYAEWKSYYFPTGGSNGADNADPDGDGASNLTEYLNGTDPTVAQGQAAFVPAFGQVNDGSGTNYTFIYKKPISRPSAAYQVQQSTDLVQWTNVSDVLVSTAAGVETRAVTISTTVNGPRCFFRLNTTVSTN